MQPNIVLCNIVAKDDTSQSHNINVMYNVRLLYQTTNFMNAPRMYYTYI